METSRTYTVTEVDARKRLDLFVSERLVDETRSRIKNLVEKGLITVNGKSVKAGFMLRDGDRVDITIPPPPEPTLTPERLPLDVIYEDRDIIVINKPPDMAVHPGAGRRSGTLVNALLAHTRELSSIGGPERPGVVHRLDKDTTGSLVVAKNDAAHRSLAKQFKAHSTTRRYLALVWGTLKDDSGVIDLPLGRDVSHRKKISTKTRKGRRAVTKWRVRKRYGLLTLVELYPETGRTHQLRVHLAAIGHPVAGDPVYCRRKIPPAMDKPVADALKKIKRQLLHAETLGIIHPGRDEYMEFFAPMPGDMKDLVELLEERCS